MTGFANVQVNKVSQDGGVVGVVLLSGATQATTTETACRECYITSALASNAVHFSIGTSLAVSLGAFVPAASVTGGERPPPVRVPIDDVGKLWFFAADIGTKVVNITYRT